MKASDALISAVLTLAWDQWTRLGVRGASSLYLDGTAVGLEELILLTSVLAEYDPRLRDEALDWCVANVGLISKPRLKGFLARFNEASRSRFSGFSAALTHHAGGRWPGSPLSWQEGVPALTRKSAPPPLLRSELVNLRIRMLFGVDARSDLLGVMLAHPRSELSASDFRYSGYTKRNVAGALNALQSGGILDKTKRGNQHLFRWRRRDEFVALVAPVPERFPVWFALVRFIVVLLQLSSEIENKSPRLGRVAAAGRLREMSEDLDVLRLRPPQEKPLDVGLLAAWIQGVTEELTHPNSSLFQAQP